MAQGRQLSSMVGRTTTSTSTRPSHHKSQIETAANPWHALLADYLRLPTAVHSSLPPPENITHVEPIISLPPGPWCILLAGCLRLCLELTQAGGGGGAGPDPTQAAGGNVRNKQQADILMTRHSGSGVSPADQPVHCTSTEQLAI
jgi:hypothetical protein